tara:strand:- start:411 stop:617 length:207 start_codon:yes stop_codon:yes gene_type:complete
MTTFVKLEDEAKEGGGFIQFGYVSNTELVEVALLDSEGLPIGGVRFVDLDDLCEAVERLSGRKFKSYD